MMQNGRIRLHRRIDTESMLGQFPGNTRHVRGFPCEDVPVLTKELDVRFFLFGVERRCDVSRGSIGVGRVNVGRLCFAGRLKG